MVRQVTDGEPATNYDKQKQDQREAMVAQAPFQCWRQREEKSGFDRVRLRAVISKISALPEGSELPKDLLAPVTSVGAFSVLALRIKASQTSRG
jgi:hypothetical protein